MAHAEIVVEVEGLSFEGWLDDASDIGAELLGGLPVTLVLSRWGDEYYGPCDLTEEPADEMTEVVQVGDLAYWPAGRALCIFFGPTPASHGDEPRAASAVEVIGHVDVDPASLRALPDRVTTRVAHR